MYGASAQFNFWSQEAAVWLASPSGGGCTGTVTQSTRLGITSISGLTLHGQKYFYASDTGCTADTTGSGNTITIRVVAGDSVDGLAQAGQQPYPFDSAVPNGQLDPIGASPDLRTPCAAGTRTMMVGTNLSAPAAADMACYPVTLGASDVTPDIFTQGLTHGGSYFDGPEGTSASYGAVNLNNINPSSLVAGLNHYQPVVVPFGLWLNSAVTLSTCTGEAAGKIDAGTACTSNAQCSSGACGSPAPVTNLPLEWITQIFSGKLKNWNELNSAFLSEPVALCLRVPGSGTLATLDYSIMKRTATVLPQREVQVGPPQVWFNFTSGDLEKCVNSVAGAIGILDADDSKVNGAGGYGPVAVEGQMPTRVNIRTGLYDYFTFENLYEAANCATDAAPFATDCHAIVENFVNFSNVPANITASGRSLYASSAEMLVIKSGAAYPTIRTTALGATPGAASLCTTAGATGDTTDTFSNICTASCSAGSCVQEVSANNSAICP